MRGDEMRRGEKRGEEERQTRTCRTYCTGERVGERKKREPQGRSSRGHYHLTLQHRAVRCISVGVSSCLEHAMRSCTAFTTPLGRGPAQPPLVRSGSRRWAWPGGTEDIREGDEYKRGAKIDRELEERRGAEV